ncbi:MAG: hypothetical protein ABI877_07440 [Gemmatimonadaceae bacterium]
MNSRSPVTPSSARRWRIVTLVLLVAIIALGVALALRYGGKVTPLLDSI